MKTHKPFDQGRPEALRRIADAVSNLIMPALSPLIQVVADTTFGVNKMRSGTISKMTDVQIEADAAATRLMMPNERTLRTSQGNYFDIVTRQK